MKLRSLFQRFFSHGLRLHEFTALFGCRDQARVRELLELQDRTQPFSDIYGLHNLRWMLFDPNQKNGVRNLAPLATQALVLSLVFDGNSSDVLKALVDRNRAQLQEILCHCHGFDANTDLLEFLKRYSIPSGYLFRDIGPLDPSWTFEPDATRAEIEDAASLQRRFERFYARNWEQPAGALRQAFLGEFAGDAFPLPITSLERRRSGEESAIRILGDASRKQQERTARASNDRFIRRGAHAKGHGLIRAKFEVLAISDPAYQVGLFAKATSYDAILRPSNATGAVQADKTADARGLAVGVLVSTGAPVKLKDPTFLLPQEPPHLERQDFVLMNHPVFLAPDVQNFSLWFKTLQDDNLAARAAGVLALSASRLGLRQAWILARTALGSVTHPLAAAYHSTTPYKFGERFIAKYSVEPSDAARFKHLASQADINYLSTALTASLRDQPIELKFYVHVLSVEAMPAGVESLADIVEDATLDWGKVGAKKVHVANIRIGPQDPASAERLNDAERARFNPWNALAEHRPLGSLNRARWAAYRESQRYRSVELRSAPFKRVSSAAE